MTPEQFLEWLDNEIAYCESIKLTNYGDGKLNTLKKVREKFLSLTPPPTTLS